MTSTVVQTAASSKTEPTVALKGVTKRFGSHTAVDNLDLAVGRGEFFTLLGPSGCGKTTTLRMVAGFETPTDGRILIDGNDVEDLPPFNRPTNTVFQSYALFPHLSVEDNVAFGLRRKHVDRAEIRSRVAQELERVGLADFAKRKPRQLSGGQQQRVALARALINLPSVLLLDEPLGALDLKLRKGLQIELKQIQREVGITFIYVTHDQEEALTMSDRIAVMRAGVIEQVDTPEHVYDRPESAFVAGFIGVSNLMPGAVESVAGKQARLRLDSGVAVTVETDALPAGARCFAVVRPEKLGISSIADAAPSDHPSVRGVIEASVYLGTTTQLVVELTDGTKLTVLSPNVSAEARHSLPGAGAEVHVFWAPECMHVIPHTENAQQTTETPDEDGRASP